MQVTLVPVHLDKTKPLEMYPTNEIARIEVPFLSVGDAIDLRDGEGVGECYQVKYIRHLISERQDAITYVYVIVCEWTSVKRPVAECDQCK